MTSATKITLPLGKVCSVEFISALTRLAALRDVLSGKDSYALMRTLDVLEPELLPHKKALDGLLRKHGAHESGETLSISPADAGWAEFIRERDELDARPVELFLDHKISLAVDRLHGLSALDLRAVADLVEFIV